jgi:hypothetical protein
VHTTATDTGYTRAWSTADGSYLAGAYPGMTDTGWVNSANPRLMWNVLYFYNSNGTHAGNFGFFSRPPAAGTAIQYGGSLFVAAGSNRFGNGYC